MGIVFLPRFFARHQRESRVKSTAQVKNNEKVAMCKQNNSKATQCLSVGSQNLCLEHVVVLPQTLDLYLYDSMYRVPSLSNR